MRHPLLPALALTALAACGQPSATDAEAAPKAPAAPQAAQLSAPPLGADGLPQFRPGLWEVTKTDSGETETTHECMGPGAEEAFADLLAKEQPNCRVRRSSGAGGLKVSSECDQNGMKIQSELVLTGSETQYDMRLGLYVVGPDGTRDGGEMVGEARWVGACPAGVEPGQSVEEAAEEQ